MWVIQPSVGGADHSAPRGPEERTGGENQRSEGEGQDPGTLAKLQEVLGRDQGGALEPTEAERGGSRAPENGDYCEMLILTRI